jgi:hypothetical protein
MLPSRIRDCIRFKWIHERFHLRKYENYYLYAWLCKRERESERGGGAGKRRRRIKSLQNSPQTVGYFPVIVNYSDLRQMP